MEKSKFIAKAFAFYVKQNKTPNAEVVKAFMQNQMEKSEINSIFVACIDLWIDFFSKLCINTKEVIEEFVFNNLDDARGDVRNNEKWVYTGYLTKNKCEKQLTQDWRNENP